MNVRQSDLWVILASVTAAAAAAVAIDTVFIEPALVEVTRYDLPLPDLPEAWDGARMIHLTDLHYGDPRSQRLFEWMVATVNAEAADLVVITGDYVVERPSEGVHAANYLAQLQAKHGVVGVLGDHDFFLKTKQPVTGVIEGIREAGVTLLRNEAIELPGGFKIAGIDPTTRKVRKGDLGAALAAVPGGKPHLLLSHAPDIILEAAERGVPMVLCGHTHGGQVVIPFYGPPVTHSNVGREYASGWSSLQETRMYTGRGLASHYSLRFCCRPEVTVFTLRRG
ncbi:MAG: hypothetical protein K0Q72_992 [Armatimonadetes bacterium]|jgi:predicted MPP superfamily phosphohydrolase|nr:hypothetical protein [Armatimonadota bacterium]